MQLDKGKKYYYSLATDGLGRRCPGKENQDLHEAYTKMSAENKALREELADIKNVVAGRDAKIKELERKYEGVIEKMKKDFQAFQANMGKIEDLILEKEEQLRKLRTTNESLTEAQQNYQLLAEALKQKDSYIGQLTRQLERVSKQNKEYIDKTDILHTQLAGLKLTVGQQNITISGLTEANSRLQKQVQDYQGSIDRQRSTIRDLQHEVGGLKQELYCSENEIRMLKQQFETAKVLQQMEILEIKTREAESDNGSA